MNTEELLDYDDLGDALREGRPLRPAREYRFLLAQGDLNFQSRHVGDPVPLGRQLLEAAGLDPQGGYSLFAILPTGDFEDVTAQRALRPARARRRALHRLPDRSRFQAHPQRRRSCAGASRSISGAVLYGLAKPGEGEAVFLEVRGGEDRLIEPGDLVDLTQPGIERFITAPKPGYRDHRQFTAAHRDRPARSRSSRWSSSPSRASTSRTSSSP